MRLKLAHYADSPRVAAIGLGVLLCVESLRCREANSGRVLGVLIGDISLDTSQPEGLATYDSQRRVPANEPFLELFRGQSLHLRAGGHNNAFSQKPPPTRDSRHPNGRPIYTCAGNLLMPNRLVPHSAQKDSNFLSLLGSHSMAGQGMDQRLCLCTLQNCQFAASVT